MPSPYTLTSILAGFSLILMSACSPDTPTATTPPPQSHMKDTAMTTQTLSVQTFNPGTKSVFPVTSTLVSGPTEAILIDAQFQKDDAKAVVDMIRASGKTLKSIYISHGDPDYYFGLDELRKAFPDVKIEASPTTRIYIEKSMASKEGYWGPILKDNAPTTVILPDEITSDTLSIDGVELKIMGLDGDDAKHSFVWIEQSKTILGGVSLFENMHVWMADAQTQAARDAWKRKLDMMLALNPETVIPGHYVGTSAKDTSVIAYMKSYLNDFEAAAAKADTSEELKTEMLSKYPDAGGLPILETSAKVITGEMSWP